jgi:3-deoxy-D-manno-octulosonic-acid transferase
MTMIYAMARVAVWVTRSSSLKERLGFYPEADRKKISIGYNVWLHAASAGEVNAITPFCRAFKAAQPEARIILTTTSQTGKRIAREKDVADAVFLAPLDAAPALKRAFAAFRPVMVLVAETELWPNWIRRACQNDIPLLLINGRISNRSFPSYKRCKSLFKPVLNCFTECLVQTEDDKAKLEALGVPKIIIQVAGQMKYDIAQPKPSKVREFKQVLGLGEADILFTLGSLREGEDSQLLPLVPDFLRISPNVKVLVAPRHLKNAPLYQEKLQKFNTGCVLRSALGKGAPRERVVVLDTMGELSLGYALSRAAFVGGTLVPVGGHNVMEPALCSVPVCFGHYTQNVTEAADALLKCGGGFLVGEAIELSMLFQRLMNEDYAREAGNKAYKAVNSMNGATQRTLERVLDRFPLDTR